MNFKAIYFNGLNMISCNCADAVSIIDSAVEKNNKKIFFHVNIFNYYLINKKFPNFTTVFENFIMFFEGIGMKIGAALMGLGFNSDINGTDMYSLIFEKLSVNNKSCFLLGSDKSVIEKSVENLRGQYNELQISGFRNGFFKINEEEEIIDMINISKCDLLIIGMGASNELDFILRNYQKLNVKAIWCVGGLFDFISQRLPRAPKIIRRLRLEWLFRLTREPFRKFGRNSFIPLWFFFHVFKNIIYKNRDVKKMMPCKSDIEIF